MQYSLRTLVILLALGPPVLAAGYFWWKRAFEWIISGATVVVVGFGVFYVVVLAATLAQHLWERYWHPNRPR